MEKNKKSKKGAIERYREPSGWKLAVPLAIIWILWVALMYYLLLPAINIHSVGFWMFVIFVMLVPAGGLSATWMVARASQTGTKEYDRYGKPAGILCGAAVAFLGLFLILLLIGAKMFHADDYASILPIEEYDFNQDIDQATAVSSIALMDTDSAVLLGNREIGSLSEVVSQYNVSEDYSQIDLGGSPVKVSALDYAGFFKYMGNRADGVPGYVQVDPVGQKAEYVALEDGMKYVPSAYFGKDLKRHLRSKYPTKIFGNIHFEVDEEGNPFYVASVYDYTIGVFGGETVQGAIVCDPVSGDCTYYNVGDIPRWVDNVFNGDLLVEQYNWYGKLSNGFWNSVFGKKGCKKCTETVNGNSSDDEDEEETYAPDYGYVAKDGDIWIYTGVTSVNDDASNIGFILVNERTSEAHYYEIAGADESSAMAAAEGEVQEKGYQASFPSLINVDDQPTYIMVLKDASGIVKLYAMVNVESYNVVTTASSLDECFTKYRALLGNGGDVQDSGENASDGSGADDGNGQDDGSNQENGGGDDQSVDETEEPVETSEMTFVIAAISYIDVDGSTWVYLTGEDGNVYKQRFADNENLIFLKAGDSVTAQCAASADRIYRIYDMQ